MIQKLMNLLIRLCDRETSQLPCLNISLHLNFILSMFHKFRINYVVIHVWNRNVCIYCLYNMTFWGGGSRSVILTISQSYYKGNF